jgi:hypothetical protein
LCDRIFEPQRLTKHHCLPKSKGGTVADVALICSQCHGMIHATLEQLRAAPELAPFLRWVRKQPASRKKRNKPRRRKL